MGTPEIIWMAILTLANLALGMWKYIERKNGKNPKYNPYPPGQAATCQKHGEAIAELRTEVKNIKEDIQEIKNKI